MNRAEQTACFRPDKVASMILFAPLIGGVLATALLYAFGILFIAGDNPNVSMAANVTSRTGIAYGLLAGSAAFAAVSIPALVALFRSRAIGFGAVALISAAAFAAARFFHVGVIDLFAAVALCYVIRRLTGYGPKPT